MKIVFFETQDWEQKYLRERLKGFECGFVATENVENQNLQNATEGHLELRKTAEENPEIGHPELRKTAEGDKNQTDKDQINNQTATNQTADKSANYKDTTEITSPSPSFDKDGNEASKAFGKEGTLQGASNNSLRGEGVLQDAEILCNFINYKVDEETLKKYPKLKFIATRSTGYDHINLKACAARNIKVSNVPTYGENTVAEFAFALLLSLSRKLYPAIKRIREEGRFVYDGLQGFDLKGKVIGIVGAGHIGMHMVKMAKGFDMHVVAYDPHPKAELAKEFGFEYLELDELLKQSDVVSLHVPYLPATHHLINSEKFKLFKKGSILINTARGGLVDTRALVEALADGTLAGAGLDVIEEEGFIKEEAHILYNGHPNTEQLQTVLADHELMQMENVLITPHNAFNTKQALERILDTTIVNIQAFAQGREVNLVK